MNIFDELALPFPPECISWRTGATDAKKLGVKPWQAKSGIALAYLTARDVMERLDDVVGGENWQDRYPYPGCCELSIRINGEWITKSDASDVTDVEGIKGQSSGAFKRAAVKFKIGRYLYDLPAVWCDLHNGQIKNPPPLPKWAIPSHYTKEEKHKYDQLLLTGSPIDFYLYLQTLPTQKQTSLANSFPKGEITKNKLLVREAEAAGSEMYREYVAGFKQAIKDEDHTTIIQLGEEIGDLGKRVLFAKDLSTKEQEELKALVK